LAAAWDASYICLSRSLPPLLPPQVPELSAFWLLSIFPQLPFVLFLSFGQIALGDFLPLDHAAGVLLTLFLVRA